MEWKISHSPVAYPDALAFMEARVADIVAGKAEECVWLLEHPPLYTAGTSALAADFLGGNPFPVYDAGRGGQYTYHGPGQRIAYVMLDLKKRAAALGEQPDLRAFVKQLEAWIIAVLASYHIEGFIREGRVGVWVETGNTKGGLQESANVQEESYSSSESKIAAIGIRVRKWVTFHGISLNVAPDLSHYKGIVPCGLPQFGVTSLENMGISASLEQVDERLREAFNVVFS